MLSFLRCALAVLLIGFSAALPRPASADEAPVSMNAAQIRLALEKLNVLGRVLYVAAHPDDENTGLIAFWANASLYDAAYLSLTRGDGGQNLIGPELGDQLGVIRTQELLAARRIDGGRQFFTRANDFGFSKSSAETLRIWDREKILADTVWAIRKFRPDVIVTRFPADDDKTHGHHTASAQLAQEAFKIAADPKRFPEQLKFVQPWQPTRLLWNSSSFFFRARNIPFDPTGLILLEAGGYQPLLGKSYAEIDAASRTMHKSQGFGVSIERGEQKEYFKFLEGQPVEKENLFSGIDTTWSRVPKASGLSEKIQTVLAGYDVKQPAASVARLLELRKSLKDLDFEFWAREKLADVEGLIAACLGLHLEVASEKIAAQPGENLAFQLEAINRSAVPVKWKSLRLLGDETAVDAALPEGTLVTRKASVRLPETLPFTQPYWLRDAGTAGTFAVGDQTLIGLPENPPAFAVEFTIEVGGQDIVYRLEPRFRKVDRVEGETSKPLVIAPPVFVELPRPVFVFGNSDPKTLNVRVISSSEKVTGQIALEAPHGWEVEPPAAPVELYGLESETTC
ncbi:MAG: PIG-L family deacetylase, partial [Verrucomicrobiota bacterium]|nr:PIG-L family deacetylase [Verrucomicrobiota bacterium]